MFKVGQECVVKSKRYVAQNGWKVRIVQTFGHSNWEFMCKVLEKNTYFYYDREDLRPVETPVDEEYEAMLV